MTDTIVAGNSGLIAALTANAGAIGAGNRLILDLSGSAEETLGSSVDFSAYSFGTDGDLVIRGGMANPYDLTHTGYKLNLINSSQAGKITNAPKIVFEDTHIYLPSTTYGRAFVSTDGSTFKGLEFLGCRTGFTDTEGGAEKNLLHFDGTVSDPATAKGFKFNDSVAYGYVTSIVSAYYISNLVSEYKRSTIEKTGILHKQEGSTVDIEDCALISYSSLSSGGPTVTITNTATTSGDGDNPIIVADWNAQFVDSANDDFTLSGTPLLVGSGITGGNVGADQDSGLAAIRAIFNVNGGSTFSAGQTNISTLCNILDATPTVQLATLGGESLVVLDWNGGQPILEAPLHISLKWEELYDLVLTDDTGSVTLTDVTLLTPATWTVVELTDIPNTVDTESFYEVAQTDAGVGNFTMVVGDILAYENATGLTVDGFTYPTIGPPLSVAGDYKIYDISLATWTTVGSYSWIDGGSVPVITSQPINSSVLEGTGSASFTVAYTGTEPITLQWQKDTQGNGAFSNLVGETTAAIVIQGTSVTANSNHGDNYRVLLTNTGGTATSSSAVLTVTSLATSPIVVLNPINESVVEGTGSIIFSASATGSPIPTVQWQKDVQGNGIFSNISGATSANLIVNGADVTVVSNNGDKYRAEFTNTAGVIYSTESTLTITLAAEVPIVTIHPIPQSVNEGSGSATFTVSYTGTTPITLQWQKDTKGNGSFSNVASPTVSGIDVTEASNDGDQYRVTLTNSEGSVISNPAELTVTFVPVVEERIVVDEPDFYIGRVRKPNDNEEEVFIGYQNESELFFLESESAFNLTLMTRFQVIVNAVVVIDSDVTPDSFAWGDTLPPSKATDSNLLLVKLGDSSLSKARYYADIIAWRGTNKYVFTKERKLIMDVSELT
tara:strand:+ start:2769 stop:5450 length:2682 start_codon:yes stop_codon:yes gene_type:complete